MLKRTNSRFGVYLAILFNIIFIFVGVFIFNGTRFPEVISSHDFKEYLSSKGCTFSDSKEADNYKGIDTFLVSDLENCHFAISYMTFNDVLVRDNFFEIVKDDVLNNNLNVKVKSEKDFGIFYKYSESLSSGDYYKAAVLNGNSILYASGEERFQSDIKAMFDYFGYNYDFNIWFIFSILVLSYLFLSICLFGIFRKFKDDKKIAFIPVYNVIYLVKKVFGDGLYSIILLIPFINVLFWFILLYRLGKMFKLNNYQTVLLMFLPLVFLPILAYGNVGNFKKSNISYDNVLKTTLLWLLTGLLLFISLIFGFVYFKNTKLSSYLVSMIMFLIYALLSCPSITNYTKRWRGYSHFKSFIIMVLAFINLILVCMLPS